MCFCAPGRKGWAPIRWAASRREPPRPGTGVERFLVSFQVAPHWARFGNARDGTMSYRAPPFASIQPCLLPSAPPPSSAWTHTM